VKAVNLIPTENKRGGARAVNAPKGPGIALIGLLVIALAFVTVYVLTSNTINDRKAKVATVRAQVTVVQAQAARLTNYASFAKLADSRSATVKQIASQRFDWNAALSDLSKVVPKNTSFESLLGTVSPSATVNGAGGSTAGSAVGTSALRSAIQNPAFEIKGCTATQDDVAKLMSRLRVINGVTRVTLADSIKQDGAATAGAAVASSSSAGSTSCPPKWPTFDLVIFFSPLPGTSATGTTGPTPASTASTATSTTSTTSTTAISTTASAAAAAPSSGAQPVSSTSPSGGSK
jgi:Tfp pilus assembly protein PilN